MKSAKPLSIRWVCEGGVIASFNAEPDAKGHYPELKFNLKEEVVEFNVNDKYGRPVGAYVKTYEQDLVPFVSHPKRFCTGGLDLKPGRYFVAYIQTARNGKTYGSSQSRNFFATSADRDSYVAGRLNQMIAKANKLAKKVVA